MKERPIIFSTESVRAILDGRKTQTRRAMKPQPSGLIFYLERLDDAYADVGRCSFGTPGDRLWVRETWCEGNPAGSIIYKAEEFEEDEGIPWHPSILGIEDRWRSSMSMPREYSRITLEITDIRCERIKSISASDCLAEGYDSIGKYIDEWNRLNAKRGYDWESNPWVWVIEFKQVKGES